MKRIWRKWTIVAEPMIADDPVCIEAATTWNGVYESERLNRYWTQTAAEMDAEQHGFMWSRWLKFRVVPR